MISHFLIFFLSFFSATFSKNVVKVGDGMSSIPVTFYSYGQLKLQTAFNSITYTKFTQCGNSTAGLSNLVISIIQPVNPHFSPSIAFAVMEVSICPNSFAQNCIIATNYYLDMDNGLTYGYDNITIPYDSSQPTLYFRLLAKINDVAVSLHMTYTDDPTFSGEYNFYVFATSNGNIGNWLSFSQLVKTDEVETVQNNQDNIYFVQFCAADLQNADFTISVFIISDPSTPLAAFDAAGCSVEQVPWVLCKVTNGGMNGIVTFQDAASAVYFEMNNGPSVPLEQGIYLDVFGVGGELSGDNNFFLTITLT